MARALVVGLGESGLAMARWLAREGWELCVADTRTAPPMLAQLQAALPAARFAGGALGADLLQGVDLLAVSPGLSLRHDPLRALAAQAAASGIDVAGEIELFARALAALRAADGYAPAVIGVTGTNGKTTTVRMLGRMAAAAGRSACVAGNVSPSALDALREALAAGSLPALWVLELSSFQLAAAPSLHCTAATILNVSEDHLDWHAGLEDYAACKGRLLAGAAAAVVNRDDVLAQPPGRYAGRVLTFGRSAPQQPGQFGIVREGGLAWLAAIDEDEGSARRRRPPRAGAGSGEPPVADAPPALRHLMPVDALRVRGLHNALNALAALALAQLAGIPLAPALRALAQFEGEPHRTQPVARAGGVEYVDDSKGTNVGATIAALRGLGETLGPGRIVVLLGGEGKGQSFAPLAPAVAAHARAAIVYGADGPRIHEALRAGPVPVQPVATLQDAVHAAAALAQPGDLVLLSPACASFDAFRNYGHRAEVFLAAVLALPGAEAAQ